ncbi:dnaJ homolog subfamily B member 14-like [Oncorhynchus keta]|nr:dnaJ homolog subfamily B member 14-like [Oncorhynchus keta]
MEVNRDEAERCIDIASAALTNNQAEKAVRFLEKAQKLFPTDKARALLDLIAKNGFTPGHDNQSGTSDGTGPRQRRPGEEDQGEKASQTAKSYTSDQLDAVKK